MQFIVDGAQALLACNEEVFHGGNLNASFPKQRETRRAITACKIRSATCIARTIALGPATHT
jgi:hypothetical protein